MAPRLWVRPARVALAVLVNGATVTPEGLELRQRRRVPAARAEESHEPCHTAPCESGQILWHRSSARGKGQPVARSATYTSPEEELTGEGADAPDVTLWGEGVYPGGLSLREGPAWLSGLRSQPSIPGLTCLPNSSSPTPRYPPVHMSKRPRFVRERRVARPANIPLHPASPRPHCSISSVPSS